MSSDDENSDRDSDTSSTSDSSFASSYSGHKSCSKKKFKEFRLRNMHYFYDKFGMCDKCQGIYWETRHTWNDDDGGSLYSYEWYGDERCKQYEREEIDIIPHKKIMEMYREKLFACRDCPRNKDAPCSLRDLAYSRISVIIGTIDFQHTQKTHKYFHKNDHEEYNRRVSKLPILDWMIKDLEAKPCKWECSHMRRICSELVSFDNKK